jgi:hypothetical protein
MVHPGGGGGQGQPIASSGSNNAAPSKKYSTRAKFISMHGEGELQKWPCRQTNGAYEWQRRQMQARLPKGTVR